VSSHISCTRSWPGIDCVSADRQCRGYEATQKAVERGSYLLVKYISVYSWHSFHRMCNPIWSPQFELTELFIKIRVFFSYALHVVTCLLDTVHIAFLLHFFCLSSVLSTFSLLTFQFKSVYWTSCESFLGTVNARKISYEHVLMNVGIDISSWLFCSSCLEKHSEVVFVTVVLVNRLFVYRIIDTYCSVLYSKWIVSDGYRPDTSETKIELNYI